MKLRDSKFVWNIWPPFLGLGISIQESTPDRRYVKVRLKKRLWNVNYFGTQWGGSIFSMTDGFHMLMLVWNLPKGLRIWDKAASIEYIRRGDTDLTAEFKITEEELQKIQQQVEKEHSIDWTAVVEIKNTKGDIVAKVTRVLSIKEKGMLF